MHQYYILLFHHILSSKKATWLSKVILCREQVCSTRTVLYCACFFQFFSQQKLRAVAGEQFHLFYYFGRVAREPRLRGL